MKLKHYTLAGLLIWIMFQACNTTTPDKYIAVTALNSNLVNSAYRPMFLNELRELVDKNRLPNASATDYVRERAINPIAESIRKVRDLNETDDTRELIAAALDLMQYGMEVFENDYMGIAERIDTGQSREVIDTAIDEMYEKTEEGMRQRSETLNELALGYARDHNVPFEIR